MRLNYLAHRYGFPVIVKNMGKHEMNNATSMPEGGSKINMNSYKYL